MSLKKNYKKMVNLKIKKERPNNLKCNTKAKTSVSNHL